MWEKKNSVFLLILFLKFSQAQTSRTADKRWGWESCRCWHLVSSTALAFILYVCVMTVVISPLKCWLVGVCPPRVEGHTISPGDRPESQLLSCPDCISIERTKSYQTSQWRERSPPSQCWRKGKWKLMNRNQVTMVQREFTTDVSEERVVDRKKDGEHKGHPVIHSCCKRFKIIVIGINRIVYLFVTSQTILCTFKDKSCTRFNIQGLLLYHAT